MRRRNFNNYNDGNPSDEEYLNLTKYDEKYILPTDGGAYGDGGMYGVSETAASPQARTADTASSAAIPVATSTDRPMVFALRNYKDMYVYEYPDRLEYYVKTASGMFLYNTEPKKR